ncbi:MAG: FKBP-type peptidyl-prolyl cis-trans isomerase [Balneolales bacterium]
MKTPVLYLLPCIFLLTACFNTDDEAEYDNSSDIAYLEDNATREGVTVTESGLQYRVLEEGDGERPVSGSQVRVHYTGTFIDDNVFDSSHHREEPLDFTVGQGVISGFSEGALLMREGAVYEIVLPAELAYGDSPPPGMYPGATLIFVVELLEIL